MYSAAINKNTSRVNIYVFYSSHKRYEEHKRDIMREYQSQQKNTSVKQINQFKIVYPFSKLCVMCVVFQINVMYVS